MIDDDDDDDEKRALRNETGWNGTGLRVVSYRLVVARGSEGERVYVYV